jgi:hypothetical protein
MILRNQRKQYFERRLGENDRREVEKYKKIARETKANRSGTLDTKAELTSGLPPLPARRRTHLVIWQTHSWNLNGSKKQESLPNKDAHARPWADKMAEDRPLVVPALSGCSLSLTNLLARFPHRKGHCTALPPLEVLFDFQARPIGVLLLSSDVFERSMYCVMTS